MLELDIYICVHLICLFLNDYTSMYTCMICEDESPSREIEQWKCETCVFKCHKKCIEKWVQSSLNEGGDGNCPYCRSPITKLQSVYTREETFAMLFVLCLSRDALPNPVPPHATPFLASDMTSLD
uniref:RING-type domain-containing protein n=1 Tax=viral metagenome TaxID=1070528 RepID=A0A6C0IZX5_9ZZZZ